MRRPTCSITRRPDECRTKCAMSSFFSPCEAMSASAISVIMTAPMRPTSFEINTLGRPPANATTLAPGGGGGGQTMHTARLAASTLDDALHRGGGDLHRPPLPAGVELVHALVGRERLRVHIKVAGLDQAVVEEAHPARIVVARHAQDGGLIVAPRRSRGRDGGDLRRGHVGRRLHPTSCLVHLPCLEDGGNIVRAVNLSSSRSVRCRSSRSKASPHACTPPPSSPLPPT